MRMSCNGCRALRKGCSENCSIRQCLEWIKSSESQANATVFLAKFYGRAGLVNLINAGPNYFRPAIFKSLLYEACGRIVNPIHGSAGLLWSGNWPLCQTAVDAVLKGGTPTAPISSDSPRACIKSYDIRHVVHKDEDNRFSSAATASNNREDLHRVKSSSRTRFKKSGFKPKAAADAANANKDVAAAAAAALVSLDDERTSPEWGMTNRSSTSHNSSTLSGGGSGGDSIESMFSSSQTGEAMDQGFEVFAAADQDEMEIKPRGNNDGGGGVKDGELELELELTLGFDPVARAACSLESRRDDVNGNRQVRGSSVEELRLDFG